MLGIVTAPRATFERLLTRPAWFGVLAVTTAIVAMFTVLPMTTEAGRQATIDQQLTQMKSFGIQTNDQMVERMEAQARFMPYTTAASIIVISPIMVLIVAGILFAIFNAALGGEAAFKQLFSVIVHAGVISTLSAVFSGTINYFRGATGSVANLGALLPMLPEDSFVGHLMGTIDVFLLWYVIVLAIGLAVLYRRKTQPIAIGLLVFYGVIALVVALIKTRMGAA